MKCPNCGGENTGKFCMFCGSEMPVERPAVNITNNFFGAPNDNNNSSNSGSSCPKCGSSSISFKRERTGTTSNSSSRSKLLTSGRKGQTVSRATYHTIGLCQNCGYTWNPNSSSSSVSSAGKSNFKWWVLGWIFIFPIPLTILMLRNKSIDKRIRYGVIALAWIIYFAIVASARSNRDSKNKNGVVDNPTTIASETIDSKPEETEEPSTESAILVETIELSPNTESLYLGESDYISVKILPENAADAAVNWQSSDESVLTVDENGIVVAVGAGNATIMASSSNGKMSSCNYVVDGSKRLMSVKTSARREDDNNIGDEWSHSYKINNEPVQSQYLVAVGDSFNFWAQYVEEDSNPDKGENSEKHKVKQEDFENGFAVQVEVYVKENGGSNSGKKAHYIVTFTFTPC